VTWVKLDDQFFAHPKVRAAGPTPVLLYLAGLTYCARYLTDGAIPKAALPLVAAEAWAAPKHAVALVDAGLWQDDGDCYMVCDYLRYNPSKADVDSKRDSKRVAGAMGAAKRWASGSHSNGNAPVPSPTPTPIPPGEPTSSAPVDKRINGLVSGYVDDYRFDRDGKDPPREWRASCGSAVKRALKNGEEPTAIAACLGVCAREGKNPSVLANVLADFHAGKERRLV
jgi:hypothetical protein